MLVYYMVYSVLVQCVIVDTNTVYYDWYYGVSFFLSFFLIDPRLRFEQRDDLRRV